MIFIKNLKVFNCSINESFHWSKLPKLKKVMSKENFNFNSYADLRNANLSYANLSYADLRNADLSYADLSYAVLWNAKLKPIDDKDVIIEDFMSVCGLGSQNRQTLIFKTNIGIVLQCGCFYGTEKQFKKQVKETHGTNNYAKEYLEMLKLAKIRFSREDNKDD
jgi:hypothetical protein